MCRIFSILVVFVSVYGWAGNGSNVCKCEGGVNRLYIRSSNDSVVGYSFVKGKDLLYSTGKVAESQTGARWSYAGVGVQFDSAGHIECVGSMACVAVSVDDLNYEINLMTRRYIRDSLVVLAKLAGMRGARIVDTLVRFDSVLKWNSDSRVFREELLARGHILAKQISDSLVSGQVLQLLESCRNADEVSCSKRFRPYP